MNHIAQKTALQEARTNLEALLQHFTRTPSTLDDSRARGLGHQALASLDAVLAEMTPAAEAASGHIAQVVGGNLANRLEWASDEAHESTPVGTKLYDEAALAAAKVAGHNAGLAAAANALSKEASDWDQRSQGHSGMLSSAHANEDLLRRDTCLGSMSKIRALQDPSAT